MTTKNLFFAAVCSLCVTAASAQTSPSSDRNSNAPATMASPNISRSSMTEAAKGTGTVVTDRTMSKREMARDGQPKAKTHKTKTTMDGTKMKSK